MWCNFGVEGSFAVVPIATLSLVLYQYVLKCSGSSCDLTALVSSWFASYQNFEDIAVSGIILKGPKEFSLLYFNCKRKFHSLQLHYRFLRKNICRAVNEQTITKQKTSVIFLSLPGFSHSISIAKPYLAFLHFDVHQTKQPF